MTWAATPVGRGARAATVAALALGLAVAGHRAACGRLPSVPVMGLGAMVTARVCWGSAQGRMSAWRLSALVVGVQAGLHLAFAVTEPTAMANGLAGGASIDITDLTHSGDMALQSAAPGVDLLPGGPAMALAHLLAALVLALWLAVGERLLWRAARGTAAVARRVAGRLLRHRIGFVRPCVVRPVQPVRWLRRAPRLVLLFHVVIRRGPPVLVPA
ncbi:hypothetical protein [Frankia sp. Cas4]|uniref:hypothetical protein n=1 Tax=Frankia sp. Cas4 TaxID=3073927 RepID=UPI002AD58B1D|nr:hypothetical protein [Frankia sp. Cas4]